VSAVLGIVLLWFSASILWWSGWKEEVAEGIPHWAVRVFLLGWPIAMFWQISLSAYIRIEGAWIWTCIAFVVLAVRLNPTRRWTTFSMGILLGAIYILLSRLSIHPATLSHFLTPWGMSIFIGWLTSLLLRNTSEQVLAITTSLLLYKAFSVGFLQSIQQITMVDTSWMEAWWIALLSARLWTVTALTLLNKSRKWSMR
jgi:hypothetical protein